VLSIWGGIILVAGVGFGLLGCLVLAVAEWGAWALIMPGRRSSASGPEAGIGELIEATAQDGVRLRATWHPAEHSTARTILMVHGFAEYTGPPLARIAALNRSGWNVARPDMRGYGLSGGDRASFGGREAGDLSIWIDVLRQRVGPELEVAGWGRSMGASICVRAASFDGRIQALVLDSPLVDLESAIAVTLRRLRLPLPRSLAKLIGWRAARLAGVSVTRPRSIDLAPSVDVPVWIAHGDEDTLVTMPEVRRLAAAFPKPAHLVEVTGAGHGKVFDVGGDQALIAAATFLAMALPKRARLATS
jgi:alpha-beta hydrolase superfamily lysophospholipase